MDFDFRGVLDLFRERDLLLLFCRFFERLLLRDFSLESLRFVRRLDLVRERSEYAEDLLEDEIDRRDFLGVRDRFLLFFGVQDLDLDLELPEDCSLA